MCIGTPGNFRNTKKGDGESYNQSHSSGEVCSVPDSTDEVKKEETLPWTPDDMRVSTRYYYCAAQLMRR
jgi:hypothetical protein